MNFRILPLLAVFTVRTFAAEKKDPFAELVRPTEPLTPKQERAAFHLPPGFEIQLVASEPDLRKPMNMQWDALGRLWITESREYPFPVKDGSPGRDTIRIFSDFAPDGRARKMEIFAEGLNIPTGIYPFRSRRGNEAGTPEKSARLLTSAATETWKCIVWSIPNIWLLEDTDGDGKADKREVLFGPLGWERDTHGNLSSFRRGADGWLYGTHGFNNESTLRGRDGSELHIQSGNTWRIRLDGSRVEGNTWGQVNPFGLCWDNRGNLFSADCHSSPIYQLLRGAFYPSFGKPHDGLGFAPTTITHSHGSTAICAPIYICDPAWPAEFQDHMFVGNVQTSRINHDAITWHGSSSKGKEMPDFLTTDDPWFRPVDLSWGPDGALYVADFYNKIIGHYEVPLTHPGRDRERGRLWRIVYRGEKGAPLVNYGPLPTDLTGWMKELGSTNPTRRTLALNELCDAYGAEVLPAIQAALAAPTNAFQKSNALWALHRLGALDDATLIAAMQDADPLVRTHALRIVAQARGGSQASSPVRPTGILPDVPGLAGGTAAIRTDWKPVILVATRAALMDSDAIVRRCAVEALNAHSAPWNFKPLLDLLRATDKTDDHLIHSTRIALRDHLQKHTRGVPGITLEGLPSEDVQVALDLLLAASGEDAAEFRMKYFERHEDISDAIFAKHLPTLARNVSAAKLESLFTLAQKKLGRDPEQIASGLDALLSALDQRGIAPGATLRAWGPQVVTTLLAPGKPANAPRRTQLAAGIIRTLKLTGFDPALTEIAFGTSADADTRAAAARALLGENAKNILPRIAAVVSDPAAPAPLREKFALALAEAKSFDAITIALNSAPRRLQQSFATALASSREGGELLLAACADGKAPALLLRDKPLVDRLKAAKIQNLEARIAALTANLPSANAENDRLIAARAAAFDPTKSDAARGAEVFARNCAVCHAIEGKGGALGPQLDGIGGRGSDRLLEDILDPNRNVDRAFRMNVITLKNGSVIAGLPRREEGAQLILADAAGQEMRVAKSEIAERKETETSLMPPTFGEIIPPAELNDLLAFLLGKRPAK